MNSHTSNAPEAAAIVLLIPQYLQQALVREAYDEQSNAIRRRLFAGL